MGRPGCKGRFLRHTHSPCTRMHTHAHAKNIWVQIVAQRRKYNSGRLLRRTFDLQSNLNYRSHKAFDSLNRKYIPLCTILFLFQTGYAIHRRHNSTPSVVVDTSSIQNYSNRLKLLPQTVVTTLDNGFRIATETNSNATATVLNIYHFIFPPDHVRHLMHIDYNSVCLLLPMFI